MVEGLRLLGSCPKCGSDLEFNADRDRALELRFEPLAAVAGTTAPHLVLGIPRR